MHRRLQARTAARSLSDVAWGRDIIWMLNVKGFANRYDIWLLLFALHGLLIFRQRITQFERQFGTAETARKAYKQAVQSVSDYPEYICQVVSPVLRCVKHQEYVAFESEEGTLADLDAANVRVASHLKEVNARREKV